MPNSEAKLEQLVKEPYKYGFKTNIETDTIKKGLDEKIVIWRHALRAAMVSILPILGIQAGFVLSGAVYIEMVFQWPGVGRMLVDAILKRDILLVQGGVVFVAACYVIFNIAVDVAQHLLDPRQCLKNRGYLETMKVDQESRQSQQNLHRSRAP